MDRPPSRKKRRLKFRTWIGAAFPSLLMTPSRLFTAGGRGGWSEGNLIPRLQDVLSRGYQPVGFFLRSMHESTLLQTVAFGPGFPAAELGASMRPRLVPFAHDVRRYFGRRWMSRPPFWQAISARPFWSLGGNPFRLRSAASVEHSFWSALRAVSIDDVARKTRLAKLSRRPSPGYRRWAFEGSADFGTNHYDRASGVVLERPPVFHSR